jgi:hypothetical protein
MPPTHLCSRKHLNRCNSGAMRQCKADLNYGSTRRSARRVLTSHVMLQPCLRVPGPRWTCGWCRSRLREQRWRQGSPKRRRRVSRHVVTCGGHGGGRRPLRALVLLFRQQGSVTFPAAMMHRADRQPLVTVPAAEHLAKRCRRLRCHRSGKEDLGGWRTRAFGGWFEFRSHAIQVFFSFFLPRTAQQRTSHQQLQIRRALASSQHRAHVHAQPRYIATPKPLQPPSPLLASNRCPRGKRRGGHAGGTHPRPS